MKRIKKNICLISAAAFLLSSFTGCSLSEFFNGENNNSSSSYIAEYEDPFRPGVNQLLSDSSYSVTGEDDEVLFETVPSDNTDPFLYSSDGKLLSQMNDSGINGDKKAGDGIYSCTYNVRSDNGDDQSYYVKSGEEKTNEIIISYFEKLSQKDIEKVNSLNKDIADSLSEYYDENGYVTDEDNAYKKACEIAADLYRKKELSDYYCDDSAQSVWMKTSSGISYIYENIKADTDGGGDDVNISVKTFQPFRNHYLTYRDPKTYTPLMAYPDDAADAISNEFECASFSSSDNLDDSEVTVSGIIEKFCPDSVIIWHGHGGFNAKTGSSVGTGEELSAINTYTSTQFIDDEMVVSFNVEGGPRIGLTYKYFDTYCGSLDNSFVYLGACSSLRDARLCQVFLDKGASAVIGNDEVINTVYNLSMIKSFCEGMAKQKKLFFLIPNGHRNAGEALEYAYKKIGNHPASSPGQPILIGDSGYKIEDAGKETDSVDPLISSIGSIQILKTEKSYISLASGESAEINIASLPDKYTLSDLEWSSEKPEIASVNGGTVTGVSTGSTIIHVSTKDGKYTSLCAVKVE